ncbi:hypothetical protein dsx2_1966 [Desulfovibrio sp. X2]|uniref:helix-turn-helix domain-containing protein n=1 Tax=Desulfovibrio sp. X2 TaxID=941449 RepID=UPI00035895C6|nr:helix-turn-helix domain-containing protein [Desulfovibrio sp. X2]EPR44038.1 hypothetical protein dsx2_1966 [Desulfovibrio sp. X2]
MAETLYTIAELAELAGISENTARRYIRLFEEFFAGRQHGRAMRYAAEAVPLLSSISSSYREGLSTAEIFAQLHGRVAERLESPAPEIPYEAPQEAGAEAGPHEGAEAGAEKRPEKRPGEGPEEGPGEGREAAPASPGPASGPAPEPEPEAAAEALARLEEGMARLEERLGPLREFGLVRNTVAILWREYKRHRAAPDALERLEGEVRALRGEATELARSLAEARREAAEAQAGCRRLADESARLAAAQTRLAGRVEEVLESAGPEEEFLRLPLVFRSERGEFLGVSAQGQRHFSLADFVRLLRRGGRTSRSVAMRWARCGDGRWQLGIVEQPGQRTERRHRIRVGRTRTPKGNMVALIETLAYDGQDVPVFFLYELFKRFGRDFA